MDSLSVHGVPFRRTNRVYDLDLSRDEFVERFHVATERAIEVAARCVTDVFPKEKVYRATWSVYNGWDLMLDEEIFGENRSYADDRDFDANSILDVIWQQDRFPRWIHMSVESVDDGRTLVQLMFSCCFGTQLDPDHPNEIYPFFVKCPMPPTDDWTYGSPRFQLSDPRRDRALKIFHPT